MTGKLFLGEVKFLPLTGCLWEPLEEYDSISFEYAPEGGLATFCPHKNGKHAIIARVGSCYCTGGDCKFHVSFDTQANIVCCNYKYKNKEEKR